MRVLAEEPSRMEAEILMRATKMSEVLEEILRHAHREPHWGLNE